MAAKLTGIVPQQIYELVRNRIAEILAVEMAEQYALSNEEILNATVFISRLRPVNAQASVPVINVRLDTGEYDNKDITQRDGTYQYHIDCYVSATAEPDPDDNTKIIEGFVLAENRVLRLAGVVMAILENPVYRNLDIADPTLCSIDVKRVGVSEMHNDEAGYSVMARVVLQVRAPETTELREGLALASSSTTVKLYLTEKGYHYGPTDGIVTNPDPMVPEVNSNDDYLIPEEDNDMGAVKISSFDEAPEVSEVARFTGVYNIGTDLAPVWRNYNYTPAQLRDYFKNETMQLITVDADGDSITNAWFENKQINVLFTNNQIYLRNVDFAQNGTGQLGDTLVAIGDDISFSIDQKIMALA